jgi:hypothetical protein
MSPNETPDIDHDNPPFPLTAIDRGLLAMKDEDFHMITWDDLRHIIGRHIPLIYL